MPLSEDPQARAWLYRIGFISSALALFVVLIPGVGMPLAGAFIGLAALCSTTANAVALNNLTPAPVKSQPSAPTVTATPVVVSLHRPE